MSTIPAQFIQEIAYDTPEAMELSRQRIAGDLRIQNFLQAWRSLLGGTIQLEVYEDSVGGVRRSVSPGASRHLSPAGAAASVFARHSSRHPVRATRSEPG